MQELAARVEAVLRRPRWVEELAEEIVLYADGCLVIDAGRLEVQCAGERVDLTATEQQLLLFLTKNQARLPSSRQILCNVWGFE